MDESPRSAVSGRDELSRLVEETLSGARAEILARIRAAVGEGQASAPSAEPGYRRTGSLDSGGRVALFCERVGDYRASVVRVADAEARETLGRVCAKRAVRRLVVPTGAPCPWPPAGVELVPDEGLSLDELDEAEGVLTECAVAVAETGTVALDGGTGQGRRALTLVPDFHLCIVRASRIVELVPEGIAALAASARAGRAITFVSGPSATSDIELSRVEGVHGPRELVVAVVEDDGQS
jgi:L-lactate dehydrogenase complex protein LldG